MRSLPVPGGSLAWRERGHGPATVVWVHGLPLDSSSWALQEDHFRGLARNVFLDLRGYGASSPIPPGTTDITGLYVDDLHALVEHLNLDDVVLVGFASAGHVALRYAARHPRRLVRLVTLNASPRFRRGPDWPWGFDDAGIARFTDAARLGGIEALTDAVLDPGLVFRDVDADRARELREWFAPMSVRAGVDTLLGFFDTISRDDDRHLVRSITTPTVVLASTIGQEVPAEVGLWLRRHLPHALLVELPEVDHFAFATHPELVNRLVERVVVTRPASKVPR